MVILLAIVENSIADDHIVFTNPSVRIENTGGIITYDGQDIKFYFANGDLYSANINNDFRWHAKAVGGIKLIKADNSEVDEMDLEVQNTNQYPVKFKGEGSIIVTVQHSPGNSFNGKTFYGHYVITVPYTGNHVWNFEDFDHTGSVHQDQGSVTPNQDALCWYNDWKSKPAGHPENNQHPIRVANPNESNQDGYNSISGTNAYYIPETAGLLFETKSGDFGYNGTIPNGTHKYIVWGGRDAHDESGYTPKFTIPKVQGGKYIKVWWDGMSEGGLGAHFQVENLLDLEGVEIQNEFNVTGVVWNTAGTQYLGGVVIFKVNGTPSERKDVVFKLKDTGWNDIYRIEVTDVYSTDMILKQQVGYDYPNYKEVLYTNNEGNIVIAPNEMNVEHKRVQNLTAGAEVTAWPIKSYMGDGNSLIERAQTCRWDVVQEPNNIIEWEEREWISARGVHYWNLDITKVKGTGNIKIIQKVKYGNSNYVLDKKETWIAIGTYKQQSYPYTWDFMDWNMKQKKMLGVLDDSNNHGISYGYWNTTSDNVRSLETHEPVAASKVNNENVSNYVWNNVLVDRPLFAQGAQLSYRYVDDSKNIDEIRALKEAEGLRVKQFWGKEMGSGSSYDNEISLDGNYLSFNPTTTGDDGHKLVITIPNVPKKDGEEMWLFIKASTQPNGVYASTNTSAQTLTADSKETGSDTYNTKDDVWAYKITSAGDVEILYSKAVNIAAIGVTNIFKSINDLGYATESRNVAIDHEYEGVFTKNDVNAYCILTYANDGFTYEYKGLPEVKKSTRVHLVPKNTGIVLYADVKNSEGKFNVPLFYPACNNTSLPADEDDPEVKAFRNNWMAPWVNAEQHYNDQIQKEWAMHRYDDNANDYKDKGEWCQKFVMSSKYYVYHKASDGTGSYSGMQISTNPTTGQKTEAFYRMNLNLANTGVSGTSNVMGANKAYLLIPSSKMPKALWNDGNAGSSKNGIIFMDLEDIFGPEDLSGVATSIDAIESADSVDNGNTYYTLSGMKIQGRPTEKGVYIMNGKKVLVK